MYNGMGTRYLLKKLSERGCSSCGYPTVNVEILSETQKILKYSTECPVCHAKEYVYSFCGFKTNDEVFDTIKII